MSETPQVLSAFDDGVFTLTLNRPERLNPLSAQMFADANAALDEAERLGARAVIVTGTGRGFSSGADLLAGPRDTADMGSMLESTINPFIRRLVDLPAPVISAVNGPAAGAGAGVALAADFVLMARSSYLLLAFVNIGLVPDAGTTFFLSRAAGRQRAAELMMLGERLSAEQAEAWGIAHRCVDDDRLAEEARALARRLANGPTRALARMKAVLNASLDGGLDETLDAEREGQREAGATDDFREGVTAFAGKRPPAFKGR